jgi:hypothetical protein
MTWSGALIAAGCALVGSLLGGVLGGLAVGRKDLGGSLAATMGAFFGPIGGFFGVLVALGVLALWAAARS